MVTSFHFQGRQVLTKLGALLSYWKRSKTSFKMTLDLSTGSETTDDSFNAFQSSQPSYEKVNY